MLYILYPFYSNARKINIYFTFYEQNDIIHGMKNMLAVFFIGNFCAMALHAESLLTAQSFPKTFEDLSFTSRIEVLREGYMPFEVQYDDNGVCISGCAYRGITIKEDMLAVDEATEEMAELIANAEDEAQETDNYIKPAQPSNSTQTSDPTEPNIMATDWCRNGLSSKLPLRYPVDMSGLRYPITSDFGFRQTDFHPAIDIGCPEWTPVYATADGVIETAGWDPYGGGNYINIEHANGIITQYLHLNKIGVKKGQKVKACQQIGLSGNTGHSSGAHLDYRVRFKSNTNKYVDILCPCKSSNRKSHYQSTNYDTNVQSMTCKHSLFQNWYRFSKYNPNNDKNKRSLWRVKNGHCMINNTDLLPDEVK